MIVSRARVVGRPSATDHAQIERAAFDLFAQHGFESTTMPQIAEAVGVGTRTLFRYFPSKNDIPWGQFDLSLKHFQRQFDAVQADTPLAEAVQRCVIAFNSFDDAALDQHRFRMRLILTTPTLQAHSVLKYEAWRKVIADYVASRLELSADDRLPRLVGHVSLAISIAAYEQWLRDADSSITELLEEELLELRTYLG